MGISPVVPRIVFFTCFFFSPNMVHSKFLWLYLYFLASFYVITLTPQKSQGQLAWNISHSRLEVSVLAQGTYLGNKLESWALQLASDVYVF